MRWADVIDVASRWPEVSEATSYGTPSLKVRRRLLTRYRPEIDSIVLLSVPHEEREHLIEAHPAAFFCEPHYADYDAVLRRRMSSLVIAKSAGRKSRRNNGLSGCRNRCSNEQIFRVSTA